MQVQVTYNIERWSLQPVRSPTKKTYQKRIHIRLPGHYLFSVSQHLDSLTCSFGLHRFIANLPPMYTITSSFATEIYKI